MKIIIVIFFLLLQTGFSLAQRKDSIQLGEIEVYGMPLSRYASGTKVVQLVNNGESGFLYKALSDETTAYFKNYGNNQLSTIAFRGTSSSHTAVLWNGININSPTLGQTDFSLIPSFLLEDIGVQYGTSSSLYGTDALGGSIILSQTQPTFQKKQSFQFHQQAGSFGKYFSGAKAIVGNERWEVRSKIFSTAIKNNFSYNSPAVGHIKDQNNASVKSYGFDQQIHFKINESQQLSLEGMYTWNFRNIQPTVTADNSAGTLKDQNTRISLSYRRDGREGSLFATAGYIANNELYNASERTRSDQLIVVVNADKQVGIKTDLRYGLNATMYFTRTGNSNGTITEERYDAFFSVKRMLLPRWIATINVRQSFYASRQAPFAPSIGSEYKIFNAVNQKLVFKTQASRGYRVPTLNDRYWIPGGNPLLKPEDALHAEGGLAWTSTWNNKKFSTDLTGFKTWVNQWILWLPGDNGIWTPSNLQKVNAGGLEASARYTVDNIVWPFQAGINYGYTRSINQRGLNDADRDTPGKQLPFVPVHIANAFVKTGFKNWQTQLRINYAGRRFNSLSNDASQALEPYALIDLGIGKKAILNQFQISMRGEVNNLLNTYYEMTKNYAMPGRNYALYLTIQFNKQPK